VGERSNEITGVDGHQPAARLPDAVRGPDSLDRMVAINYAGWLADLALVRATPA
jgi:hypothetical protein